MSAGTKKLVVLGGRPDRIVRLTGTISSESVLPVIDSLLALGNDGSDPIMLYICSPGGCVSSGLALLDVMEHVSASVFTVGMGLIASMAAIILIAGQQGYRYALPHTRIMLHPVWGSTAGRLQEVESATQMHRQLDREIEQFLLARTKIPRSRLRRLMHQERFLCAQEAIAMGVIDHIL
jgi:ATP-dependent Clp protease, protease subunit